ncbi:MAG: N-acetylmuramoyl-L-alanine amidase [Lachnospiraceae bacterium]|nr:N-acetylmuramoyl-L-alanine amidase [Lachnospiraceae bacterium]
MGLEVIRRKIKYGVMLFFILLGILCCPITLNATEITEESVSENAIVVVIDPGHGGKNAGAIYGGYIEKTLTLNTAKAMKEELEKYDGIKVYLTRDSDVDMELGERTAFAKEVDADLLLSLHYNMSELHKLFGTECWISAFGRCYAVGRDFSSIELEMLTKEGLYDRGIKTRLNSRGTDYYGIIRSSTANDIPAVIIEHCHLDQVNDKPYIDHNTWPQKYGVLDATAVARYFGLKSEQLGVDYSNEVHEATPVPNERMSPDDTPPEWCEAEVTEVDEQTGMIRGKMSAYDPDSRILYYTVSFNNGKTFGEYYRYEPDENGDVYFEVQAPNKKRTRLVVAALNMYGGLAQSELLYVGRLTYLPDEEAVEETIVTTRQTADLVEESGNPDVDDVPNEDTELSKRMKSASYFVLWVLFFGLPILAIGVAWKCFIDKKRRKTKENDKN